MKKTREARIYAEAVGKAVAFGIVATTCDIITTPTMSGYIHSIPEPNEWGTAPLASAFDTNAMERWVALMTKAEDLSIERKQDSCTYGVCIMRSGTFVSMSIVRHHFSLNDAIDSAVADGMDTVYNLHDYDEPIPVPVV